jgi:predicted kinase
VWVVAGAPGAGKSTVASLLAARLAPPGAVVDKDTLYSGFVAEVLAAYGREHGEREGPWYDEHVKVHEYGGMTAAAAQIRRSGAPVVLVAPFTQVIRDVRLWGEWVSRLGGDPVRLVWVRLDPTLLHARLVGRGRSRDCGKLADFETFVTRVRSDEPPPVPHLTIDSSLRLEALPDAVATVLAQGR